MKVVHRPCKFTLTAEDVLQTFAATCGQQCSFWNRPCPKEDIFAARDKLEQIFSEEQEDQFKAAIKELCRLGGWRFNEVYRKRNLK